MNTAKLITAALILFAATVSVAAPCGSRSTSSGMFSNTAAQPHTVSAPTAAPAPAPAPGTR